MVVLEEIICYAYDAGMYLLFIALSISFLTGARMVARKGSTTSLVGANVATISLGTALIPGYAADAA